MFARANTSARGQLLATLDPTFTAANVKQLRQQIASLEAQVTRIEAELADRPLVFPNSSDPDFINYAALQKALYEQRSSQYKAQINSYDAKLQQINATIQKLQGDESRYQQREGIAKDIETMRTSLEKSGSGSRLNMLLSQDARLEMLRSLESTHNSLIESRHTVDFAESGSRGLHPAVVDSIQFRTSSPPATISTLPGLSTKRPRSSRIWFG